jgi:hypothetical protein
MNTFITTIHRSELTNWAGNLYLFINIQYNCSNIDYSHSFNSPLSIIPDAADIKFMAFTISYVRIVREQKEKVRNIINSQFNTVYFCELYFYQIWQYLVCYSIDDVWRIMTTEKSIIRIIISRSTFFSRMFTIVFILHAFA